MNAKFLGAMSHRAGKLVRENSLLSRALLLYYGYLSPRRTPPQLLNYVGGPEFDEIGKTYFAHIRRWTDLKPDERVLDVGCGMGRVAVHLADYLSERGSYEGFDIVELGVRWCEQKIAKQHANFRFRHANVHNEEYNEKGVIDASSFVFPYAENEFDFVFATSVFTHMLPDAVLHYLTEIHRVLRPGGRSMISFFLLDALSKKHLPSSPFPFKQVNEHYSVMNEDNPEAAIAFEEPFVRTAYAHAGLTIASPIHHGTWSGRTAPAAGQDIIVATKP